MRSFRARLALLLGLAALLLLAESGAAPLERAEIYFLDAARAMVERGDFVVPYYRGEPFFDKPPLAYWLIAAAFRLFGFTLEAARLVPALAALGAIGATVWLGTRLFDRETALLGGLVLATTGAFVSFGRLAMSDMLLTLWSTLALALGTALLSDPPPRGASWLPAALAAALGFGFLTKGPIALLLPGLGLLVLAWQRRERTRRVGLPALGVAAVVLLVVTLPWFVLVHSRLGWEPIVYFFLSENLGRFAGETYDSGRSPAFYLGAYALLGLPWSLLLPCALARLGGSGPTSERLLALWIGLMLVPLSLSRGKIDYYLLPVFPAASLLVARFLRSQWTPLETSFVRVVLGLAALALFGLTTWASLPSVFLPGPTVLPWLRFAGWTGAATLLMSAWRLGRTRLTTVLASASALACLSAATLFLPALRRAQPNAAIVADVMRELRARPEARLVHCEDPTRVARELLFQARLASIERCDLWAPAASSLPFLLLVREEQHETLRTATRFIGEYRYVPASVTTLEGLLEGVPRARLVLLANFDPRDLEGDRRVRQERKRRVRERERQAARGAGDAVVP